MKITAALCTGPKTPFEIDEVELDEPRSDEVLVKVHAAGVCHTDLTMRSAWPVERSPIVLGHEGAGVVQAVGRGVSSVRPGDRVAMSYRSCTACPECSSGHPAYCQSFRALNAVGSRPDGTTTMHRDGHPVYGSFFGQSSFASHVLAYESNLVVVGDSVDFRIAAPLGCGIQTGAGAVLNVLRVDAEASLAIFGAGSVGLSGIMAAKAVGVQTIIAVEPVDCRRAAAAELGATAVLDPTTTDVPATIREIAGGGVTHALDTTALAVVVNQAIDALRPRGMLALVGLGSPELGIDVQRLIAGGKTIRGTIEGDATPQAFLPRLLELHATGALPLERFIKPYAFEDINLAATDANAGSTIKPVLVFDA